MKGDKASPTFSWSQGEGILGPPTLIVSGHSSSPRSGSPQSSRGGFECQVSPWEVIPGGSSRGSEPGSEGLPRARGELRNRVAPGAPEHSPGTQYAACIVGFSSGRDQRATSICQ